MATTTNFGWTTPNDTDLVKDGAAAIRTLGSNIDASLVDLKGGTTGQVLAKASNTDLDYSWVTDATGIPATIFDAKGDIIAATAADTASRLAVGANDTVLTADSTTATGLKWAAPASGGETLLSTTAITAASTITVSGISTAYNSLRIAVVNMAFSSGNDFVYLRLNGVTASNYGFNCFQSSGSVSYIGGSNDTSIMLANQYQSVANTNNGLFNIYIPQYANTTSFKTCTFSAQGIGSSAKKSWFGSGGLNETNAITSISLIIGAGTFTAQGSILVYGVK